MQSNTLSAKSIPLLVSEISIIALSLGFLKGPSFRSRCLAIPREKYPEMEWQAPDKVTAWRQFRRQMEVIYVADQVAADRQWALILVAGGNEAYNHWDTLEETVKNKEVCSSRYGRPLKRASSNPLRFGISETYIWQMLGKQTLRQQPIWTSASSRLSKDASGRKRLRSSE